MEYCLTNYGKEMVPMHWLEFCDEKHIAIFTARAIEAAFNDPKLYEEMRLFARDINELARKTA